MTRQNIKYVLGVLTFLTLKPVIAENITLQANLINTIIDHLYISRAIIITDDFDSSMLFKKLASGKNLVATMTKSQFLDYINGPVDKNILESVIGHEHTIIDIFLQATSHAQTARFVWLVFSLPSKGFHVRIDCFLIFIIFNHNTKSYQLIEFYTIKSQYFVSDYGQWSEEKGLHSLTQVTFNERRLNCKGAKFHVFKFNKDCAYLECVQEEILQSIAWVMNLTYVAITPEYFQTQRNNSDETELVSIDASNLVQAFHSYTFSRDNLGPIREYKMYFYVKHGTKDELSGIRSLLRPFSNEVWMAISVWMIASSFVVCILDLSTREHMPWNLIVLNIFTSFDILCNQCGSVLKDTMGTKVFQIISRFSALFVVPSYSAAIISFLTLQQVLFPFNSMSELMKKNFKICAINQTFAISYFQKSNHPDAKRLIGEYFLPFHMMPLSAEEGLQKVCNNSKYSFLGPDNLLHAHHYNCKILQAPKPVFSTFVGIPMGEESPFKRVFKRSIIRLFSSGVIQRMAKIDQDFLTDDNFKSENENNINVKIKHVTSIFGLLSTGIITATIILLFEILSKKKIK